MNFRLTFIAVALTLAAGARADEAPATPTLDPKEQANLQNFAASNPACVEWSDGCAVCKRATAVSCSTPGIACLPGDIVCKAP